MARVSRDCVHAFTKYLYDHRPISTVGIHRVDQRIELVDWLVGETQRLVEDDIIELDWVVDEISGVDLNKEEVGPATTTRRAEARGLQT